MNQSATASPVANPWKPFGVVLFAGFMTLLDVSIVNVALPSIESTLASSPMHLQWIVAGYSLAFGLTLIPAGRLGDVIGHRGVFIFGSIFFVLASLACGLAPSATALALFRVLQGAAAGILSPQVMGFLQLLFTPALRPRAFGYFGMTIGVSTAIGPTLGGLIVSAFGPALGWRMVFLINLPLGFIIVPLAIKLLPKPAPRTEKKLNLDAVGLILLGLTVLAIMWPFVMSSKGSLASAPWWTLAIAAAGFVLFNLWEAGRDRRQKAVVVSRSLMKNPSFVLGSAVTTAYFAGQNGYFIIFTLYLQQGLGMAPWLAGIMQIPLALSSAATSARSGRLLTKYGRKILVIGLLGMISGVLIVIATAQFSPLPWVPWLLTLGNLIIGASQGVVISPNQALTLSEVPVSEGGVAGGLLQTTQRIGASIGIAMLTMLFFSVLAASGISGTDLGGIPADQLARTYANAFSTGLIVTIGAAILALIAALADYWRHRHVPAVA